MDWGLSQPMVTGGSDRIAEGALKEAPYMALRAEQGGEQGLQCRGHTVLWEPEAGPGVRAHEDGRIDRMAACLRSQRTHVWLGHMDRCPALRSPCPLPSRLPEIAWHTGARARDMRRAQHVCTHTHSLSLTPAPVPLSSLLSPPSPAPSLLTQAGSRTLLLRVCLIVKQGCRIKRRGEAGCAVCLTVEDQITIGAVGMQPLSLPGRARY